MAPLPAGLAVLLSCGCSSSGSSSPGDGGSGVDAATSVTEHGTVVDFTQLSHGSVVSLAGVTVTDGNKSTTTDAQGKWSLTLPAGTTLSPVVSGMSMYDTVALATLFLPDVTSTGGDVDRGAVPVADASLFQSMANALFASAGDAIVYVSAYATGSCPSVAGGTLTVTSPPGARVAYFGTQGSPDPSATSFLSTTAGTMAPVAVIYDVPADKDFSVQVLHPTCKAAPFPFTYAGGSYSGHVKTTSPFPGGGVAYVSALLLVLQ